MVVLGGKLLYFSIPLLEEYGRQETDLSKHVSLRVMFLSVEPKKISLWDLKYCSSR